MQLTESWRSLSESLLSDPAGVGHARVRGGGGDRATRDRWYTLFSQRPRPLLVPAHNSAAQRGGLRFFIGDPLNLWYARALLRTNAWLRRRSVLPELSLPRAGPRTLLDRLTRDDTQQLAFLIGTPGPYQKASMLMMSGTGEPRAVLKIALSASANDMIVTEARQLAELEDSASLAGRVPQVLATGLASNGCRYVLTTVVGGRPAGPLFTAAHAEFLCDLASLRCRTLSYDDSPLPAYLHEVLRELGTAMRSDLRRLLEGATSDCAHRLGGWRGPFVLAHGDFAPWNIRCDGLEIAVFDWEFARHDALALGDVLHFLLAPPASSGRRLRARHLRQALGQAHAFARLAYPDHEWSERVVDGQGLAYLIQTVLFFAQSRGRVMEEHAVIRAYCELIAERSRWMA